MTNASETNNSAPLKLMLIDGHSMAFRAFYGLSPDFFRTSSGQYTNAVHNFLSILLGLIKNEQPDRIVVAFDLPGGTFRTEQYPEYKGGRAKTPEEFNGQIDLIQRLLAGLNIPSITKENFEADDIVATLATKGAEEGYEVLVVSGDRDTFQLINDDVLLLYPVTVGPSKGIKRMDAQAVIDKYKIPPHLYPDLAALTGEKADNIPGVPGVGEGFAAKWILEYGDLTGVLENADRIKGKKGEALRENLEQVRKNRKLNQLVRDLDLGFALSELTAFGPDKEVLEPFFDEVEFRTIRTRTYDTFSTLDAEAAVKVDFTAADTKTVANAADFNAFVEAATKNIAGVERPAEVPESLKNAVTVLPVVEDGAPSAGNAGEQNLLGLVLLAGIENIYLEFSSLNEETQQALSDWLVNEDAPKIIFDAKANYKSLWVQGFDLGGVVEDPLLSSYVCGNIPTARRRTFDAMLEDLTTQYLLTDFPKPAEAEANVQGDLFAQEPEVDLAYQSLVARFIQEIAYALTRDLQEQNQIQLYTDIELPLAKVLAKMERTGIAVDADVLANLKTHYKGFIDQATEQAYSIIGHEVNLSSPKQLQGVLFEELQLPPTRKLKSGYSTDADSMADLLTQVNPDSDGSRFLVALQTYRDFTKLKQTVEGLQKAIADDGRIHTTFQQNVAATGRLSSTDPNLQNIPIRTEEGRKIRGAFVVDPRVSDGTEFASLLTADYSQIEMRIMVHLAQDEKLIQAYKDGEDLHRFVGSEVFGVAPEDVTPEMRSKVKAMSYGLAYGLSRFGLSKQLGIPVNEAAELTVNYFKRFGAVGKFLRTIVKEAHSTGYTETMFGRRRQLPDLASSVRARREAAERAALNAPIQGTAADIMKIAMLNVDRRLEAEGLKTRMLLQIHDELILEVAPGEEEATAKLLEEEMSKAVELSVPMDVAAGTGKSWHEAAH